jgi:hypothetical protein
MASLETPRRITTLDAVNIMLAQIGESPVTIVGPTAKPTAQKAEARLAEENIRIQSMPYNSFRQVRLELEPDPSTGFITLPSNILSWHPVDESQWDLLTESAGKLFNTETGSHVFTETVPVEAVLSRPFDSLSQTARWYITCSAAISFANTEQPGGAYLRVTAEMLNEAKRAFEAYDRRLRKGGMRLHNPFIRRMRGNR